MQQRRGTETALLLFRAYSIRLQYSKQCRDLCFNKSWLTPTDRATRCVASHPVVILLCTKLDAKCDRQATVVSRLLTTFGDDRRAVATLFLGQFNKTMRLSYNVFELQQVICQKLPILTYPPAFGAPTYARSKDAEIFGGEICYMNAA